MIPRHVIYCDHYPDGAVEAGSNARERKPATVSHDVAISACSLQWFKRISSVVAKIERSSTASVIQCKSLFQLLGDLATVSNKGKLDLNKSKVNSFVSLVAKNSCEINGDRHKTYNIFPTNCFVLVITLV